MLEFYKNKRVFLTGHTGFKGTWLSKMLIMAGADVTGYALHPGTEPNLFGLSGVEKHMHSIIGDVRDLASLQSALDQAKPEIVIHMAAQPIVRTSYREPRETYETNVMGTVNLLECVRSSDSVRSFLNVTTDKVYENVETERGYVETDKLDGYDPYSNSKSCSELVTHSYARSFFGINGPAVSTARAGNVIGGGDFSADRILPDCVRSAMAGEDIIVRNPQAVRPFQWVLEPLFAYLLIIYAQWENPEKAGWYNVGPADADCVTVGELVDLFCRFWGNGQKWISRHDGGPHEAGLLRLDCTKIRTELGWEPRTTITDAVEKTVEWSRVYAAGESIEKIMEIQINGFGERR